MEYSSVTLSDRDITRLALHEIVEIGRALMSNPSILLFDEPSLFSLLLIAFHDDTPEQ